MNLEMVSLKDLCESEEFLRRDFKYVFFTLVVFLFNPFSFRRVGEFWVERDYVIRREGKKSRQDFSFPALPPVPRTYQKMLTG